MRSPVRGLAAAPTLLIIALATVPLAVTGAEPADPVDGNDAAAAIKIEPAEHAMLVGDRVKLVAQICRASGRKCRPATQARWRYEPSELVTWTARRGAVVVVESTGVAGTLTARARQDGAVGTTVIVIGEVFEPVEVEIEREGLVPYVLPEQASLDIGEVIRIAAWGCPVDTSTDWGPNDVPDGIDDACEPLEISMVVVDEHAPVTVHAIRGPSAVLQLTSYPGTPETSHWPIAVQVATPAGVVRPQLQARDRVTETVQPVELAALDP